MRVIILGISGLIGHKLFQILSESHETFGTLHSDKKHYGNHPLFAGKNVIENVEARNFSMLEEVLHTTNPDFILNCVGITKRKEEINQPIIPIEINALLPHRLAAWASDHQKRVIQFSTDCVFDGKAGNYTEDSLTTAEDIYGRTKALGEIKYENTLTIRSSFIGQEMFDKTELLEWLLSQNGKTIKGFTKTFYSGVSVNYMASLVNNIITNFPALHGLYQLAPEKPISKFDLLTLAKDKYNLAIEIIPDESFAHTPTLDGSRLKEKLNNTVPSWEVMMEELAKGKEFYTT